MDQTSRRPLANKHRPHSIKLKDEILDAIKFGRAEEVTNQLQGGRSVNKRLKYTEGHEIREYTPLCMAIEYAEVDMVNLLLRTGANPEKHSFKTSRAPWGRMYISREKVTPLYLAVRAEKVDVTQLLIDYGACPDKSWGYRRENEEEGGSIDYLEMTDEPDLSEQYDTVLHVAMRYNLAASAEKLLLCGANATCINQRGESPLHLACQHAARPTCSLVQQVIRHGGICQSRDSSGLTPLQHFVSSFISSTGESRDTKQITWTLTCLLDAGYKLKEEVWLKNLQQIQSNSTQRSQTWSLNFIYKALISTLGQETLQMLLDWEYKVKSLGVLSRIAVREVLGTVRVQEKIQSLPLPHSIKTSI